MMENYLGQMCTDITWLIIVICTHKEREREREIWISPDWLLQKLTNLILQYHADLRILKKEHVWLIYVESYISTI